MPRFLPPLLLVFLGAGKTTLIRHMLENARGVLR
jgi:G3E family GTPase